MSQCALPSETNASKDATPPLVAATRGKLPDEAVWEAILMIDQSGVIEQVTAWKDAERRGPGGRPETFPLRALLVAMVVCPMTGQPMLATQFTDVLYRQISPTMRHALGVPKPPPPDDIRGWRAAYRNVRTRLHGVLDLVDPSPTPKDRRLDPDAYDRATEACLSSRTPEQWAEREARLTWLVNQILEMSLQRLPRDVRRHWRGSIGVDATVVPTFARPDRREPRRHKGKPPKVLKHSSDPDADWYTRGEQKEPGGPGGSHPVWGYELSMAVSGNEDPESDHSVPTLVVGMAPLHKPGHDVGRNATSALRSIHDRGHPAHYLAADRAYTAAKAEDFQLPARALGYDVVFDYRIDQLGKQGSYEGMLQIDGAWYCPSIPEELITATIDFRKGDIEEDRYRARLVERWRYLVKPKQQSDDGGHVRLQCPAAGAAPTARCELKPRSERRSTRGRLRVPVTISVRNHPPKICTQQSVTVPPEEGAKFAQALLFGSEEWHTVFSSLRNSTEGMNGYLKDGAHEALDDPERRRIRGRAAQSLLVAFLLCAANLRKIAAFVAQEAAVASGAVRRLPSRRRTRELSYWFPDLPNAPTARGPDAGPDPPQTA